MASIRNHYLLLIASNFTRLNTELDWVANARSSSVMCSARTHSYCTRNLKFH